MREPSRPATSGGLLGGGMSTFGTHLRDRRTHLGRTMGDVARQVGISVVYLSEMERGTKPPPGTDLATALARTLDILPETLLAEAAVSRGRFVLPVAPGDVRRQELGAALLRRWEHLTDEEIGRAIVALGGAG